MNHPFLAISLTALALLGCGRGSPPAPTAAPGRATTGLGYTLSPPEGFSLAMESGSTKNWTPGGLAVTPIEPRIILGRSSKIYPANDALRRVAPEAVIRGLDKSLTQPVILGTEPVTIDGMAGFEITARAMTVHGGDPVMVYAASLFAADGTFHIVAYDGGEDAQASLDLFRASASSLVVK